MPRFKPTEQQSVARASQASPDAFGAAEGRALSQVGGVVSQIGGQLAEHEMRMQERADVIDRVRQQNAFNEGMVELERGVLEGMDISSPDAIKSYRDGLKKLTDDTIASHTGSSRSKAALRANLEARGGQGVQRLMGDQIAAQQALLADSVSSLTNELASVTAEAPDALDDSMAELDDRMAELAPALTSEQEREYKRAGQEAVLSGAITSYLERGDAATAKSLMNNEKYANVLSPAASRRFRIEGAKVEAAQAAEQEAYEQRVAQYSLLTNRDLTPNELARIELLPDKPSEMTPADKIAEYEVVTGQPASQAVVDQFFKVSNKGKFGDSLRGRALSTINDNLASYSSGTLSPQEAVEYQSAVFEAYGVKEHTDPVKGERTRTQPTMPPAVRQALDAGAAFYGDVSVSPTDAEPGGTQAVAEDDFSGPTLWELRDEVSGPITAAERTAFNMFGVGDPKVDQAAQMSGTLQKKINTVLQNRPGRVAEQYRLELENIIRLEPEILRSDTAYTHRLAHTDLELRTHLKSCGRSLTVKPRTTRKKSAKMRCG